MRRLRSLFTWLASLCVLIGVVWWLASRPVVRFTLGAATELLAEPGVEAFLLHLPDGSWSVHTALSRDADDGRPLPDGVIGHPALQTSGSVIALVPEGLVWVRAGTALSPGGEQATLCPRALLPEGVVLEGTIGGKDALLSAPVGDARRLFICPGGPLDRPALYPVMDRDGPSLVPQGAPLITARATRALAFLGTGGWEAWTVSDTGLSERAVAKDCVKPGALFTPDGLTLIVPGKVAGIFRLSLTDGRNNLMCDANLGLSQRVPQSWAFRDDPLRLVTPQWDLDGWLQIAQIHVPGDSRGFNMGAMHHYGLAMSYDGRTLAYVQASFDEQGDEPFMEELYLFDFDRVDAGAEQIDERRGGQAHQGPCFVGNHSALVYLARGEAVRIDMRSPASNATPSSAPSSETSEN